MFFDGAPAEEEQSPEEVVRDQRWWPTYAEFVARCQHGQRLVDCDACSTRPSTGG
jgi:hypothetical protein